MTFHGRIVTTRNTRLNLEKVRNRNVTISVVNAKVTLRSIIGTIKQRNSRRTNRLHLSRIVRNLLVRPRGNVMIVGSAIIIMLGPETPRVNFGAQVLRLLRYIGMIIRVLRPRRVNLRVPIEINFVRLPRHIFHLIKFNVRIERILGHLATTRRAKRQIDISRRRDTFVVILFRRNVNHLRVNRVRRHVILNRCKNFHYTIRRPLKLRDHVLASGHVPIKVRQQHMTVFHSGLLVNHVVNQSIGLANCGLIAIARRLRVVR